MPRVAKDRSLLDLSAEEYQSLSDEKAIAIAQIADARHRRQAWYASLGMLCGTATLAGCVCAFVYLVRMGHSNEGYYVLGAAVLAMIGRIVFARL
jgi:hypothetical protein